MDFTKETFLKFCRAITRSGVAINLSQFCNGFGYFEAKPYANESTIRYNINVIINEENKISFNCSMRIRNFNIGNCIVDEITFLRHAKEISLHYTGVLNEEIEKIYKSL